MKKIELSKISINPSSHRFYLWALDKDQRVMYHMWLDDKLKPEVDPRKGHTIVYRNTYDPVNGGILTGDATRKLNLDRGDGRTVGQQMLAWLTPNVKAGLFERTYERLAKERVDHKAAVRAARLAAAAQEMYDTMVILMSCVPPDTERADPAMNKAMAVARDVIARVDAS